MASQLQVYLLSGEPIEDRRDINDPVLTNCFNLISLVISVY